MNPYGPQMYGAPTGGAQTRFCPGCRVVNALSNTVCCGCGAMLEAALAMPAEPLAQAWACPACRNENRGHYEFCLGCGAARVQGGGAPVERRNGYGYGGSPVVAPQRSPVVLILVIVGIVILVIAAALAGVVAMFLAR